MLLSILVLEQMLIVVVEHSRIAMSTAGDLEGDGLVDAGSTAP